MPSYTVTLTDTEKKAFDYVALDVDHWIKNAATNRARIAKEEIVKEAVPPSYSTETTQHGSEGRSGDDYRRGDSYHDTRRGAAICRWWILAAVVSEEV